MISPSSSCPRPHCLLHPIVLHAARPPHLLPPPPPPPPPQSNAIPQMPKQCLQLRFGTLAPGPVWSRQPPGAAPQRRDDRSTASAQPIQFQGPRGEALMIMMMAMMTIIRI
eukprot:1994389-Pyramimonas_sp.AAC.1